MGSNDNIDTRVLIVGAGPAGLSLAIELGHRGIACLVVERNARVGYAPRAKTTNVRTREHLRRWGIAGDLRAASPFGMDLTMHRKIIGQKMTKWRTGLTRITH